MSARMLDGKVALITGGARGQGRSHALTLAAQGADIILADAIVNVDSVPYALATPDDLAETAAAVEALGRRVLAIEADVRDQAQLDEAVARGIAELGQIDILLANAGVWGMAPFWKLTEQQWQDMIDIDLSGVWRSAKAVAPHMIERQQGVIVMTSSANGVEAGHDYAHYVAAKHGVIGLMKSVALELGSHNVRCHVVCPGIVDSPMNDWPGAYDLFKGGPGGTPEDRKQGAGHWSVLARRNLLPTSAISQAILFLVSDASADLSGVVLPIDGGHTILPGFNPEPVR
jgi:SDR family mycofactocin-dependent oxidoreductase